MKSLRLVAALIFTGLFSLPVQAETIQLTSLEWPPPIPDRSCRNNVQPVTGDATNLRKVAGGRIPLAVVDSNVFDYLVSDELSNLQGELQMNDKLLEQKELYVAFARNNKGERLAGILNKGLEKIDQEQIMKDALKRIMN